ncbi:DUF4136 domain-containing protein [Povalibacter sp.]|uniref:DUF4136 domain-containing protein n=1 Tax=Povalibacter sp. TaxID=1962978 RepID=UPI002F4301D5
MTKPFAPFALSLLLLSACATDPIEMAGDPSALPAFRTFKVQEERLLFPEQIPDDQRERIARELRQAAVGALQGRGYQEVAGAEPADVLIVLGAAGRTTMSAAVEEDLSKHINPVNTDVFEGGIDTPTAVAEDRPPGVGREGDLILYILDPATQRSLWRASSSGAASTPGEALRKAQSVYRSMVRKLPVASG